MQVVEEDVDQISVVGEEEEETRVSIFIFLCIARLMFCLLSGLALESRGIVGKPRPIFLLQQKYFVSEKMLCNASALPNKLLFKDLLVVGNFGWVD